MKVLNKTEIAGLKIVGVTAVQSIVRLIVHSARAIRADTPEMLNVSLAAADGAVTSLVEIGVAIIESMDE